MNTPRTLRYLNREKKKYDDMTARMESYMKERNVLCSSCSSQIYACSDIPNYLGVLEAVPSSLQITSEMIDSYAQTIEHAEISNLSTISQIPAEMTMVEGTLEIPTETVDSAEMKTISEEVPKTPEPVELKEPPRIQRLPLELFEPREPVKEPLQIRIPVNPQTACCIIC
jgi:hypothetical protein